MPDEESELEQAKRHVAAAERVIAQQRERIAKLKSGGHPVTHHQRLLDLFVSTLEAFKDHERLLEREVAEKKAAWPRKRAH
jgi:hypothetical protein